MRVGSLNRLSGRLAIGALLIGVLPLLSPPPALAALAAPSDLTPDGAVISGSPVLDWSRVNGAVEYDVQIATSPDFGSALYDETTENSQATPTSNLPTGVALYWRVRSVSSSHVHSAWATASFDHSAAAGPTPLTPDDGADLQQPDDSPLLTWTPVNGATSYTLQVDNDDLFADPTTSYTSKTTAYTIEDAGPEQTYYWRVLANFPGNLTSEWSEVRTFNVLALPAPDLISPDDSSTTQVQDAVLDWAPVPGAVKYEVRVSTDDQFNTLVDSATVKSTRYADPVTYDNDQYWWEVRAIDANDNKSPWTTSLNQFQRNWPDKPSLVYPADESTVGQPMYYEWDGVPHASMYRLEVGADPSFSPGTFDICLTANTTYTVGRSNGDCRPSGGVTYWRVRAIDAPQDVNGIYSDIHSFTYGLDPVTLTSPADGTTVTTSSLVLAWNSYPNAEKYRLTLKRANGTTISAVTTYALSWSPTGSVRLDPTDGPFHWTVSAQFKDGSATAIPVFGSDATFNVLDATDVPDDPDVAALTPTSPDGQQSERFPSLTWEPYFQGDSTPAAYYQVFVARASNPGLVTNLGSHFTYTSATYDDDDLLGVGDWVWYVQAFKSDGTLLGTGPAGHYTISQLGPVTGVELSLTGQGLESVGTTCSRTLPANPTTADVCGNLQQTPVLKWDVDPKAGLYMVYIARDRELTNMVYTATVTNGTMFNPTDQLADSQAGTAYYWFIRPCKTTTVCAPDPTEASNAFDKRSNPVSGLTESEHDTSGTLPAHGPGGPSDPPDFADEVVLSWDDYLLTSHAGNDKDVTGMPAQLEAEGYKVEISSDPNFASGFIHKSGQIDQTTYTPYLSTLPEGPLYWRVQAVDGSGNLLAWSLSRALNGATQSIEKVSPTPTLVEPTGQTVTGTPAFSWAPLNYAAQYEIQIARHGDSTFATGNRAVGDKTTQTSYVPSVTLPTSGNPYVWRIRRIDVDNRAGGWSSVATFTVSTQAPTQITPTANAYVPGSDSLFTWLPVDGAASYRVERRIVGSTSTQENRSTTALEWAPLSHILDGRYEWRVSAYDQGNSLMGASPWRPFKVDDTKPTVVHKEPTSTGSPKTAITVDFSERVKGVTSSTFKIFVKGNTAALPATVTATNHHKSAKLDPTNSLKVGKTYTIKLLSGIKDTAGHSLKPVSWSITIEKG